MSIDLTEPGQRAYRIVAWAYEDPPGRARNALQQVNELARRTPEGPDLTEVQDAGTMLARLAGSLGPQQPQLSGLISDQVMDLAAWQHEARDRHGKWTDGPAGSAASAALIHRQATHRARTHLEISSGYNPSKPARRSRAALDTQRAAQERQQRDQAVAEQAAAVAQAHVAAEAAAIRQEHKDKIHEVIDQISSVNQTIAAAQAAGEAEEKRKALHKLAVEGAVALIGALLAVTEVLLGVPALVLILSALAPVTIQVITEFIKKL